MSFMEETVKRALPIWNACIETPFVQELKQGTLPSEKLKKYMIQNSIYLKYNARIYGKAIYHATTLKEIQQYYSVLRFVTDTESAVRLSYLKQFGLTDDDIEMIAPSSENQQYIDFQLAIAEEGDIHKILMVVLPCMLSYSYIFQTIAADPDTQNSKYRVLINDYTNDHYISDCKSWRAYADEKCASLSDHEREQLTALFVKASRFELNFWHMVYNA